jgi:hypothetical protein
MSRKKRFKVQGSGIPNGRFFMHQPVRPMAHEGLLLLLRFYVLFFSKSKSSGSLEACLSPKFNHA